MRNWQAWTCTLITFTGSGTIRSSIKQLQCNAYYFTGPYHPCQDQSLKPAEALQTFKTLIRIPESLCPLPHILSMADTLELFSIEAHGAQALGSLALQLVVILVRAVGPVVGT